MGTSAGPHQECQFSKIFFLLQDVELTAKPYIIKRMIARVDAFFGAAYSNLEEG